jgi:hypothetical protein
MVRTPKLTKSIPKDTQTRDKMKDNIFVLKILFLDIISIFHFL